MFAIIIGIALVTALVTVVLSLVKGGIGVAVVFLVLALAAVPFVVRSWRRRD